jgi:hypothetical protein
MLKRSRVLSVLIMIAAITSISYADQPRMTAARTDLLQARGQLQVALRNKGGHRAKAIGFINAAINEINKGIRFDRRNNHAQTDFVATFTAAPDQPHMQRALENLRSAKSNLEAATSDKGGHRVNAIAFVNRAIDEVKLGIEAGE